MMYNTICAVPMKENQRINVYYMWQVEIQILLYSHEYTSCFTLIPFFRSMFTDGSLTF